MTVSPNENLYEVSRRNMLSGQLIPNRIHDSVLLTAMGGVARELFLPERLQGRAYADESIALNPHAVMLAPQLLANLLLLAELKEDDFILDVRAATGYAAAVMGNMVKAVVALENDASMCETAQQILIDSAIDNVAVLNRPPEQGFASQAPFDVIFIEGVVNQVPEALPVQLAEGGRLICVTAKNADTTGKAVKITKKDGVFHSVQAFDVDLTGFPRLPFYKNFVFDEVS